jgi:hypothetical protein
VPRFQRDYSWDASNVEDLWDDVVESGSDYFIGSMVIFEDGDDSGLVDGQQRITTITMMLAAIRNELIALHAEKEADGIQTLIERTDPRGRLRFVLFTESSYPYLQAGIQSKPGAIQGAKPKPVKREERDLERAFDLITEWTGSITASARENKSFSEAQAEEHAKRELAALRDKIYGLTLVLVEVGNEEDATTIFQTLNSRGKDLETADIVKAHLLQMLKPSNPTLDPASNKWDAMKQSFDESAASINMNKFLLHCWLSREEYAGEKDLFKKIKKRVRSNNAQEYLDQLVEDAVRYRTVQEPVFRLWKKPQRAVAESLRAMNLFRLQQHLPFVLSVLREYDAGTIKLPVLLRAVQGVERFHFLATAVTNQPSSGGVSRMYASAARAVLNGSTPSGKAGAVDELLDKLRDRIPTYAEFEAAFIELRSSRLYTQQTPLVRYVLDRLHVTVSPSSATAPIDLDLLTVEHVASQAGKGDVSSGDVARIGNLILVSEELNKELGDRSFAEKQKVLKGVPGVEREILDAKTWKADEIIERSKRLARRAFEEVWLF